MAECLNALGAEVSAYDSGVKGLGHLTKIGGQLDAVMVSSNLADMTGAQFVDALAKNSDLSDLKVMSLVYMSSQSHDLLANNNARVGAHLTKPVRLDSLHSILGDLINDVDAMAKKIDQPQAVKAEAGGRVLVVEDNEINQMVALGMLESLGSVSYTHLTLPTTPYV